MPRYDVPAARTALHLIRILAESPEPLGVSAVARALGTNKNMAFRLLTTLVQEGWVAAEEPGPAYFLSLTPFRVTSAPVQRLSLKVAAREPMRKLHASLGESLYLGILHNHGVLYIEHLDSTRAVRIAGMIGGHYPLYCTAPGKVLLAHATEEEWAMLEERGMPRHTPRTIVSPKQLRRHLRLVAEQGFAVDNEEFGRGLLCYAAPVRDHDGAVAGTVGVSVTMLTHTMDSLMEAVGPQVMACANEISKRMGGA